MEVSNTVLKQIIKECCRSLSYNDEERQFSFPLYPYVDSIWENLQKIIHQNIPDYYLNDFNHLLSKLGDLPNQFNRQECKNITDSQLLNGEVIEIILTEKSEVVRLIKMKVGQYLNYHNGIGISVGKDYVFRIGHNLKTSEGKDLGRIQKLHILMPSQEHIVISKVFIGNYYKRTIGESLWPLYDSFTTQKSTSIKKCSEFLATSKDLGINSFTLLNILNAATNLWR